MRHRALVGSLAAGLLVIVMAAVLLPRPGTDATRHTAMVSRLTPPPAPEPAAPEHPPAPAAPVLPSFDVVKVAPDGTAVIAGRAAPGSSVVVRDGDRTIGEVTADRRGEWVLVPERPIAPGDRLLSLEATSPQGGPAVKSDETVALSIGPPAASGKGETALAVVLPRDGAGPARVLQRPEAPDPSKASTLSLDALEYDGEGHAVLSGRASPGATVQIYAGNQSVATATADASGGWSATTTRPLGTGLDELRLDQLAQDGHVQQRVAVPLAQPAAMPLVPGQTYTVQPGNSLWQISRRAYGAGHRYLIIYSANLAKIRDPERIYPGQVFKVPKS